MTEFQRYQMTGLVATVFLEKGYGFIAGDDGIQYFFHRSDATDFDRLIRGARVSYTTRGGAKGPRAGSITLFEHP
jgi:CspA family cold shock protein